MNDADIYKLVKEEVDFDPSKTETLYVFVNINNKKKENGQLDFAIDGIIPWITDDVSDKVFHNTLKVLSL